MITLSANLSMLFTEYEFLDRFEAAARSGFRAVEIQFPYDWSAREIRAKLEDHDLKLVMFNLPAGDFANGDRGIGANWERRDEFAQGLDLAMTYVDTLRPDAVNLLAGVSADTDENDLALLQNTRIAAEALAEEGVTLLLEPINTIDVPGFALPTAYAALDVIEETSPTNVRLQLDVYHAVMSGEDPLQILRDNTESVGHIQIADVPGRHEPGTGEIDWPVLFAALDALEYNGHVGLEYIPSDATASSFSLLKSLGLLH